MNNVFKIRHGKETHVYRTEISADKKNLLSQFRHVAEELAAKRRKEREGEHQRRKSLWMGSGDVRASTLGTRGQFAHSFLARLLGVRQRCTWNASPSRVDGRSGKQVRRARR